MPTKRHFVDLDEFDSLIRRALARTYSVRDKFDNESDFKFELYHNLHQLKLNGHRLGSKLLGHPTCLLHAEAKAENGNPSKADLLICNPARRNPFNYSAEAVIELKTTLNSRALNAELKKFTGYRDRNIRRLYLIPANRNTLSPTQKSVILEEYPQAARKLVILDRSMIRPRVVKKKTVTDSQSSLIDQISKCIKATLNLYGKSRRQYHGFFWCNHEHEQNRGWTFPVEGDFNAQLYHRLRSKLPRGTVIQTEYRPSSGTNSRVDLFITRPDESIGIEVKMNWDQLRVQPNKAKQEVDAILEKLGAMEVQQANHANFLVVIQGEDGYRLSSNNKAKALQRLRGNGFSLFYYDERRNIPTGPVTT
ncbi:MAG: hypothetical protein F4Y49_03055 [Dehalococcoidia bacterium]|nr:hypothetical protein [Dehalococcoidia bacterium]